MGHKRGEVCGLDHPSRRGVKCWDNDREHSEEDQHYAYISDPHSSSRMRKITWRVYKDDNNNSSKEQ